MTDRAINFQDLVEAITSSDETEATDSPTIHTVAGSDPIDVCSRLFERLEGETEHITCEFYMSLNTRREMERRLVDHGPDAASMDFLERQIRTDVSMPDERVLFMHPDAVTLGGTVTGSSPIGIGTISNSGTASGTGSE